MRDLQDVRKEINSIDKEIAALFEKRMDCVTDVATYKMANGIPILDEKRESAVIERNSELIVNSEYKPYYVSFIQSMMAISRKYQDRMFNGMKISYSGVEGAFAHIAASRIFPSSELVSCKSFEEAYEAVENGECDLAVLPIENSYEGEVGQVADLMYSGSLYINGVYDLPISQNLLAIPGAKLKDITRVISHPQALGQCHKYIKKHNLEEVQTSNTARAAMQVAEEGDIHTAAIASVETAEIYGLNVLDHDINESRTNTTRFAVFSKSQDTERNGSEDNFILIFTVNNEAGALANAINIIGKYGFSMKVLRSRPLRGASWEYYFYVEAEGNDTSEDGKLMLKELGDYCNQIKVVGHYATEIQI